MDSPGGAVRFFGSQAAVVEIWRWCLELVRRDVVLADASQYKYKHTLQREQRACVVVLTALVGPGGAGGGRMSLADARAVLVRLCACVCVSVWSACRGGRPETLSPKP